jgi:hypothetical protein
VRQAEMSRLISLSNKHFKPVYSLCRKSSSTKNIVALGRLQLCLWHALRERQHAGS